MRVISRARLRKFWQSRKQDAAQVEGILLDWERLVKQVVWKNWGALTQTFGTADRVGNCVVFDIGNNRYRLIARVMFDKGRVFVLRVMDHEQYDKKDARNKGKSRWEDECGCHRPAPKPTPGTEATKRPSPTSTPQRTRRGPSGG